MTRARILIRKMGGRKRDIYRSTSSVDPDTGADIIEYSLYKQVLCYLQPTGSEGSVRGIVLHDIASGDDSVAEYFVYHDEPLENHDRLQYNGKWYEIRAIENWESSFMKFWKSYLIEVNNENQ